MLGYVAQKYRFFASLSTSLKSLILSSFVVAFGSFMVTPFLAIFLERGVGMELHAIGTLVAVATFVQFGGGVVGGVVADRFGLKPSMVFALAFRTVGFVMLAFATIVPAVTIPAVLLVAAGPAVYLPANKAYILSSVSSEMKPLFLSISNAALNAGMALGPLVAAVFINDDPRLLLFGVAILFTFITLIHQGLLTPIAPAPAQARRVSLENLSDVLKRVWRPVVFNTLTFFTYFYFQNFMGLYAANVSGVKVFGWVMLLNFVMMFVLQPMLAGFTARANYRLLLVGAFSMMSLGMLIMSLGSLLGLLLGTAFMTVGEIFLFLRGDLELVAQLPEQPAIAFGIQRLTAGVGGLLSGIAGGSLFAHYKAANTLGMFWVAVASQCALAALLSLAFARAPAPAMPALAEPSR
ncbi:MFS transporter [Corallococcus sp. H22C18031201]|nr:MFS transporter [Corallococcus sp. H22C18031201]